MTRIPIQNSTTQTAAFDGSGVDVSVIRFDTAATLVLEILSMTGNARFSFETSADSFATLLDGPAISITGPVVIAAPIRISFRWPREFPDLRLGIASTAIRLALSRLSGVGATVNYQSWIEVSA